MSKSINLFWQRKYWPFFWTQFLGAFNDNFYKTALLFFIQFKALTLGPFSPQQIVALSAGIFILPFALFSTTAGQLADCIPKHKLVQWIKIAEIGIVLIGAVGFLTNSVAVLIGILFLLGLQSTFFGPIKYSILPQLVDSKELVDGNALIVSGTFVAILLGQVFGGPLVDMGESGTLIVCIGTLITAVAGTIFSFYIKSLPASCPELKIDKNPLSAIPKMYKILLSNRTVHLTALANSWFWFIGSIYLTTFPVYTKSVLHGSAVVGTALLALFSVGISVGSNLCSKLSTQKLEIGLVPFGSLGISLFTIDLFFAGGPHKAIPISAPALSLMEFLFYPGSFRIIFDLFMVSVFSGLYIVPVYTLLQDRTKDSERSRVIAINNILNAGFMVAASCMLMVLYAFDFTVPEIFLITALLNLVAAAIIYSIVPEYFYRFVGWILSNVMYRIKIKNPENLPLEGPAVIVSNHVTFVDWLFIGGAIKTPIRFVMHYSFTGIPIANLIFRRNKVIPIASKRDNPGLLDAAYAEISNALKNGQIVCIFPEGMLTRDGNINQFRKGIERIMQETPVLVIPIALSGLWGSYFSWYKGKPLRRPFRRIRSKVVLNVGNAISPSDVTSERLQAEVEKLLKELEC